MSKTDRQFAAVEILRDRGPMSSAELRQELRERGYIASDRTFSRDETELQLRGAVLFCHPDSERLRTDSVPSV